jgi:hypothetical protein
MQNRKITLWSWALLERPLDVRPLDSFPAFHGTWRFNTEFTRALRLFLALARPIQSTSPHPTSPRSILILSTHLHLGLPRVSFPLAFPPIIYKRSSSPPFVLHGPSISSSSTWLFERLRCIIYLVYCGLTIIQAVNCWLLSTEAQVQFKVVNKRLVMDWGHLLPSTNTYLILLMWSQSSCILTHSKLCFSLWEIVKFLPCTMMKACSTWCILHVSSKWKWLVIFILQLH